MAEFSDINLGSNKSSLWKPGHHHDAASPWERKLLKDWKVDVLAFLWCHILNLILWRSWYFLQKYSFFQDCPWGFRSIFTLPRHPVCSPAHILGVEGAVIFFECVSWHSLEHPRTIEELQAFAWLLQPTWNFLADTPSWSSIFIPCSSCLFTQILPAGWCPGAPPMM